MKLFINIVLHILLILRSYSDHSKFFHVCNYGCGFWSGMNIGFQQHFKILFKKKMFLKCINFIIQSYKNMWCRDYSKDFTTAFAEKIEFYWYCLFWL